MFNLLVTSNTFFDASWFFPLLQNVADFFSKLGSFALTPTENFVMFCTGEFSKLEYTYAHLNFEGHRYVRDFVINRDGFGGVILSIIGTPLSLLFKGVPEGTPLFVGILLASVEWYFTLSIVKFLLGMVF